MYVCRSEDCDREKFDALIVEITALAPHHDETAENHLEYAVYPYTVGSFVVGRGVTRALTPPDCCSRLTFVPLAPPSVQVL